MASKRYSKLFLFNFIALLIVSCGTPGDYFVQTVEIPKGYTHEQKVELSARVLPHPRQLKWWEDEFKGFIHYGINTYSVREWGTGFEDAALFNPGDLDTDQWCRLMKAAGIQRVIMVVKHHEGYCLWQTRYTDHSVASSPWRNGQGDVLRELAESCEKYGIKPGLYISGGDKNFGCMSSPDPMGERKIIGDVDVYFPAFMEQLRELLTNYGEIDIVWFDGAYDPFGWDVMNSQTLERLGTGYGDAIRTMVRNLQPQAVVFGGTRPDVRWSGSEQGWAPYPLWNCVTEDTWPRSWVGPENLGWLPAEANIHTRKTWFWSSDSDQSLRDVNFLLKVYLESIGRGANLLINMTPDTTGIIPEIETDILKAFGDTLQQIFSSPKAEIMFPEYKKETNSFELDFPEPAGIRMIEIEEDIVGGQRVLHYVIEYLNTDNWVPLTEGQSIGRKRLQEINHLTTNKIRLVVTKSNGIPAIKKIAAY